jgi:hypothetical protein
MPDSTESHKVTTAKPTNGTNSADSATPPDGGVQNASDEEVAYEPEAIVGVGPLNGP